jgi:hypothetical protein
MHPDERSIEIHDAFSTRFFGGNVAGVVHADERLDDDAMQEIAAAAEVPVATTGFVSKLDDRVAARARRTPGPQAEAHGRSAALGHRADSEWGECKGYRPRHGCGAHHGQPPGAVRRARPQAFRLLQTAAARSEMGCLRHLCGTFAFDQEASIWA